MFRDKGPIHNIGYGVSSREMPSREGETETPSPNSGYIAKALDQHPMMRFFGAAATALVATTVASRFSKGVGLKLGKALQDSSDTAMRAGRTDALPVRTTRAMRDLREALDELGGVARSVDGVDDPYSKIVHEVDGKLTTGYDPKTSGRYFRTPISEQGRRTTNRGRTSESAEVWTRRDDIQIRMVKLARRLPYELPAMYVTQRAVTDKLFGGEQEGPRVKWYNPADVISDFVKQSTVNLATMMLPFEAIGAAGAAGKSSLTTLASSMSDLRALSPLQQRGANAAIDLRSLLAEVGQDLGDMTSKALRISSQTSGAFSAGIQEVKNAQPEFMQGLYAARHGAKVAAQNLSDSDRKKRLKTLTVQAKGFFTGESDNGIGILDTLPSFRGIRTGSVVAKNQFKSLGVAHDVVSGRMTQQAALGQITSKFGFSTQEAFDDALRLDATNRKIRGLSGGSAQDVLNDSIRRVQSQHSSGITKLSESYYRLGAGGPSTQNNNFKSSEFYRKQLEDEYKGQLSKHLVGVQNVDQELADRFVANINIGRLPSSRKLVDPTNRISLGRNATYDDFISTAESNAPTKFFDDILTRFEEIKGGEGFRNSLSISKNGQTLGQGDALRAAIDDVDFLFVSKEFRNNLNQKIVSNWNQVRSSYLPQATSQVLKPAKQSYLDFLGKNLSEEKQTFLLKKTAQTLGIDLVEENGKQRSIQTLRQAVASKDIDPTDSGYMRDFLFNQGKLKTGFFTGGTNFLGFKPVLVDEAAERGMFKYLPEEQQAAIRQIASAQATFDPVTGGLGSATETMGRSVVKGMYKSRSGDILDFNQVANVLTRAKDFIASDFRIPIVGFNPADMLGNRSLSEMRRSPILQYVSSRSVQPFVPQGQARPDFFMLNRTKGTKGVLTSFTGDEAGNLSIKNLSGLYRPVPSSSTEIFSREARNATGLSERRVNQSGGDTTRFSRFKQAFDIDAEQPNSLIRLASRFKTRSSDIRRNNIMSRLISSEGNTISYKSLRGQKSLRLDKENLNVVDEAGQTRYNVNDVLSAVESFRKKTFGYLMNPKVMKKLEDDSPSLFTAGDARATRINTVDDFRDLTKTLQQQQPMVSAQLRRANIDADPINTSFSRLTKQLDSANFDIDQARNEAFRFIAQRNQLISQARIPVSSRTINATDDIFTQVSKATRELRQKGEIGIDTEIEAKAYAISTLFNFSAFSTFKSSLTKTQNSANAFKDVLSRVGGSKETRELFDVFNKSQISMVDTAIGRPFSRALPVLNKYFGTAPYEINEMSTNLLGSGQQFTMVPTFGTVFSKDPFGAIKSALGLNTYQSPETFSSGSIPVAHMFGRLNKYFGTVGLQLDQNQYKGPIDLYLRGMVGKRALPIAAGGASFMAVDSTLGGMVNEKDQDGNRVYSPFFTTKLARVAVEGQSIGSGLVPGGMSYEEKKDQLINGEVPIRQGRFWPLGTTPFEGGKVLYHRPSYYRKLAEGSAYTPESAFESPMEKLAFGYDFSPLRPLDPYRFERENYYERPYPVTGQYFTGPFGPATSLANLTIGRVLKPELKMHEEEVARGLAAYVPAGESGAYNAQGLVNSGRVTQTGAPSGMGSTVLSLQASSGSAYGRGYGIGQSNASLVAAAGPLGTASSSVSNQIGAYNQQLINGISYGPPKVSGVIPPSISPAGAPISYNSNAFQVSELGYRLQETAGIYGFAFGSLREGLGFGSQDMSPQVSVLQSAAKGYGTTRAFWDLNLGGLGDVPLPGEGTMGNIEISEIVRRFIPKERNDVNYINPIPNVMGQQYPFLPGPEYFNNFKTGDPYTKVPEGEIRLPGTGYERFNTLYGDETGRYGKVNQLDILADVAPYSTQYRSLDRTIKMGGLSPAERIKVEEIRGQVEETTSKYQFSAYKYKGTKPEEMNMNPTLHSLNRVGEFLAHRDTFFNTKFLHKRTAVEDWERRNVYGSTFPEWQRPYESFIEPMLNRASQRDPLTATIAMAGAGSFFGRTVAGKTAGSIIGGLAGFTTSVKSNISEAITGQRSMPEKRVKEIALEEHMDILTYVKNTQLAAQAEAQGDSASVATYTSAARRTMYGADIYSESIDNLSLSIPKRKREHFKAMIQETDSGERERVLSTAGRLERRVYQAAWGMKVEEKPDLAEYFTRHELPDQHWEGWHPNTNMDHVKIKMGQQMGLEMSQMGYYPQQVQEANLVNPSYPSFFEENKEEDVASQLRGMMSRMGVSGSVRQNRNPYGSNEVNLFSNVRLI